MLLACYSNYSKLKHPILVCKFHSFVIYFLFITKQSLRQSIPRIDDVLIYSSAKIIRFICTFNLLRGLGNTCAKPDYPLSVWWHIDSTNNGAINDALHIISFFIDEAGCMRSGMGLRQ